MNTTNKQLHKKLMDNLYLHPKFPEAIDLWTSFFAKTKNEVQYSNWRYLNAKRQEIENKVWKKLISSKSKVLDMGCGKGFFLKRLYDNFGSSIEYYGVDISSVVIHYARNYFSRAKYFISPGEQLPFENETFNYIQIISTLEHVVDPCAVVREAYRVLKDRGYLYIVVHKRSFDPLIISTVYLLVKMFLKKLLKRDKVNHTNKYSLPLSLVRKKVFRSTKEVNFKMIEKGDLISHIDVALYRKLYLPMPFLLKIANVTNNLHISIFKNLEYRVYQK